VNTNPPLPTVTVTVVPLATPGHKVRSEVIVNAAAIMRDEEFFIAPRFQHRSSNNLLSHAMLKR
jgi:hypothetical protein